MTTVPEPTLGPNGLLVPAVADILQAVLNDLSACFPGGFDVTLPAVLITPWGQLATTLTAIIADRNDLMAYMISQVDPLYAQGSMQDAIGLLYFMTRLPAIATSGDCLLTGLPGTNIPAGSQAKDQAGNIYVATASGVIAGTGQLTLNFACLTTGPIACPAGDLNQIYLAIPGWSSIANPEDLIIGRDVETQQAFEQRRQASVAGNAQGNLQSVQAAVAASGAGLSPADVPYNVFVTENFTSATTTVGYTNYPLAPHSIYVAAVGGVDAEIAKAIWSKKSIGCNYNGNTPVTIYDESVPEPWPAYLVTFERPSELDTYLQITIRANSGLPGNYVALIRAAVLAAFAPDGSNNGQIGATVYASDFYAAVMSVSPAVQVLSLFVGSAPSPNTTTMPVGVDQYSKLAEDGSSITVGVV